MWLPGFPIQLSASPNKSFQQSKSMSVFSKLMPGRIIKYHCFESGKCFYQRWVDDQILDPYCILRSKHARMKGRIMIQFEEKWSDSWLTIFLKSVCDTIAFTQLECSHVKMLSGVTRGLRSSEFSFIFTRVVLNTVESESTDLITLVCVAKDMVSAAYAVNQHQSVNINSHFHISTTWDDAANTTKWGKIRL